jgi:hypothetical protein
MILPEIISHNTFVLIGTCGRSSDLPGYMSGSKRTQRTVLTVFLIPISDT